MTCVNQCCRILTKHHNLSSAQVTITCTLTCRYCLTVGQSAYRIILPDCTPCSGVLLLRRGVEYRYGVLLDDATPSPAASSVLANRQSGATNSLVFTVTLSIFVLIDTNLVTSLLTDALTPQQQQQQH